MSNDALREGSIDHADPTTKEEFTEFKNNLVKKLQSLSAKTCYNDFIEDFIKDGNQEPINLIVRVHHSTMGTTETSKSDQLWLFMSL